MELTMRLFFETASARGQYVWIAYFLLASRLLARCMSPGDHSNKS